MKCRNLFFRVLFLIVFPCGFVLSAPDAEEQFLRAQTALRAREFSQAVKAFSGLYRAELSAPDQALYLQAVACFYDKKFSACRAACDKILSDYPESDWYRKAVFLQASAFVEEKNFPEAEKIYEAEARRLLSGARKDEIAGVIVAFADDLCVEPGADELDRPQPNYYKAYSLYARVMEMEIGRDLRDEVLFKRATAISKAGNPHQAINDFKQYLQEFDPRWHGLVGEPVVGAKDEIRQGIEPGAHIMQARFKLAEALLAVGQQHQCRWEAEELLTLLTDIEDPGAERLAAETRRLVVRSFSLPNPISDFEQAIDAVHDFLKHHPAHPHAVKLAFDLAVAYQNQERSDDAVAAYQTFIDGKNYRLPAGAAATDVIEDLNASPVELQEKLTREALFQIGVIRLTQKRYDEAIARWESYVARYPNGPHWAQCQNSIIDAKFQIGLDAVEEEDHVRAREVFEEFLRQHPLDPRAPQILFIFGQMHYAKAEAAKEAQSDELERSELDAAVGEWRRLVGKYPGSEPASAALYRIGMIQEEKFGDMEAALDSYRRLNWGSSYQKAQQRIAAMINKRLAIESERIFRTDETPGIRLETRNIEKVTVRIYRLNLDAYFRKAHEVRGIEDLDVALIEADETFEVQVAGYEKYRPYEQIIEIPFDDDLPGACVVNVSEDDWEATTLVVRSDLEMILKSSRREALVFVQDVLANDPADEVEVLLSDGQAVFATGTTADNGVFHAAFDELADTGSLRVLARRDGHFAACNLNLQGLQKSSGLTAKGYIYTDRPAYRPGEEVAIRGILRDVKDQSYAVPEGRVFTVRVTDSSGRLLVEEKTGLSRFGTFDTSLILPSAAPLGDYTIMAQSQVIEGEKTLTFSGTFKVAEFKLEKIRLALDFPRRVYFRGETVEAKVKATFYWGEPLAGREIRYRLPDGRQFSGTTDAEGVLNVTFDTSAMVPGRPLPFHAEIPGENVRVQETVFLAQLGFSIQPEMSQDVVLDGEPVDVNLTTLAADGKPVGKTLNVTVLRRETPKPNPVLSVVPWLGDRGVSVAETTVQEHEVTTDPETGRAILTLTLDGGGRYTVRVSGRDRFKQTVLGQTGFTVSGDDDATRLRIFADSAKLDVGGTAEMRLHSRLNPTLALITHEGEAVINYDVVRLDEGTTPLGFEVGHDLFPNFRVAVAAISDRKLHEAHKEFTVERQLNVAVKPLKDSYEPGAEGRVELTVTDQLGRPVEAELSLALVNEALFAVHPDRLPPIIEFFQKDARRYAEFRVDSNAGFRYVGVTRAVVKEVLAEGERLERAAREKRRRSQIAENAAQVLNTPMPELEDVTMDFAVDLDVRPTKSAIVLGGIYSARSADLKEELEEVGLDDGFGSETMVRAGGRKLAMLETRREVQGEARWLPGVVTDADGKAVVTLPMPETTTEWRLTARGCTPETLVGEGKSKTLTKKDFFVELKTPSFVREGDGIRVTGRVHNLTEYAGPVKLLLTVTGRDVESTEITRFEKVVRVRGRTGILPVHDDLSVGSAGAPPQADPKGTPVVAGEGQGDATVGDEFVFPEVRIPKFAGIRLRLAAMAGEDLSDAIEVDVPVDPWGMEYAVQQGGVATTDTGVMLRLPDHKYGQRWLTLSVGRGAESAVVDLALDGALRVYDFVFPSSPRWCPSSGSDLLAAVRGMEYVSESMNHRHDAYRRLRERAVGLVGALTVSQLDDGGWGMRTGENRSDWAASARSYWALVVARNAGIAVNEDTIKKAQAYLDRVFRGFAANDNDAKALVLHALSVGGNADFANCNRLYRERNSLSPAALAYMVLTFANQDRGEAGELADVLLSKARSETVDGRLLVHWESGADHTWMNDATETTALALAGLARVRPEDAQTAGAAAWLMQQRGCYGLSVAKTRGPVVNGLAWYFGKGRAASQDMRVTVLVNDQEVETIEVTDGNGVQTRLISVPERLLRPVDNRVEFKKTGSGEFAYAATLRGFSEEIKDPQSWRYPYVHRRHYYHERLSYSGRPINVQSTSHVENLELGRRTEVFVDVSGHSYSGYLVLEEPIPAGARVVEGSLKGNFSHYQIQDSSIVFHFPENNYINDLRYELVGYVPGTYRVLPTIIRDPVNPGRMRIGQTSDLTVLAEGERSPDEYQMNHGELYELGRLNFDDGRYREALGYLDELHRRSPTYNERELARMLLWIYTADGFFNADRIVNLFEVLRERYPELEIPFDRILTVGRAYREMKEFERAWLVFRATIDASFISDSNVSALLQDEGRFMASIDYQERLWREYPDTADTVSSYFALTQALYQKAPNAHELPEEDGTQPERLDMLARTADMLTLFLTLYPNDPLADDAAFSLANSFLDLRDFETVVRLTLRYAERYADSNLVSAFQYMTALGYFWQNEFGAALDAARTVAEGTSRDKEFAQYIVGQVYHAQRNPEQAIEWYKKISDKYPDARECIEYFQEKRVSLDEVTVFRPGEDVELELSYRNIEDVALQVYRVDLMTLYLREKNLSTITQVHLAGIAPETELDLKLGDGKDYIEKTRDVALDISEEGAYLVICRGDDLFTSGLVLVSPLQLEVQEEVVSGRVRVNVLDAVEGGYCPDVHVKAVGSADGELKSGETDLRGIFVADDIRGKTTVIARDGDARYAFYRGEKWLGVPQDRAARQRELQQPVQKDMDFKMNLRMQNEMIQQGNFEQFDQLRRQQQKGVEVQKAF